ncbi:MAG: hypothetical protein U0165_14425 [Polyangiaceae bacterium]
MSVERQESSVIASLQAILEAEAKRLEDEANEERARAEARALAVKKSQEEAAAREQARLDEQAALRERAAAKEREERAYLEAKREAEIARVKAEEERKTLLAKAREDADKEIKLKELSENANKLKLRRWLSAVSGALMMSVAAAATYYAGVVAPQIERTRQSSHNETPRSQSFKRR